MEAVTRAVENTEYELDEAEEAACLADVEPHAIILTEQDALSMSALGQKQTFERTSVMSALPPRADILRGSRHVR